MIYMIPYARRVDLRRQNRSFLLQMRGRHQNCIYIVPFSPTIHWSKSYLYKKIVSTSFVDSHKLLVTDITNKKELISYDIGKDTFPVDLTVLPGVHGRKGCSVCISSSDGKIAIFTLTGLVIPHLMSKYNCIYLGGQFRPEKRWVAHQGATIQCVSSPNGTEILTCGEDGTVKIWSRNGLLRSTLVSLGQAIYCVDWSPDGSKVVLSSQSKIQTKPITPNARGEIWTAHQPLVTALSWGGNDVIASGGEDGRYKLWDTFGRILYQSKPSQFPITEISFSPTAEFLLIGTFGQIKLCDQSGTVISSIQNSKIGSTFRFSWSQDGLMAIAATGCGNIQRIDIGGVEIEDGTHHISQLNSRTIQVTEIDTATSDTIDTTDRITALSLNYKHIIIATTKQLQVNLFILFIAYLYFEFIRFI